MTTKVQQQRHLKWALELTSLPTAAGHEDRVMQWIEKWVNKRPAVSMRRDRYGNMLLSIKGKRFGPPVFFTAHMDHPAFVVTNVADDCRALDMEFRGGIRSDYFTNGRVLVHGTDGEVYRGRVESNVKGEVFDEVVVKLMKKTPDGAIVNGDIATWDIKPAFVKGRRLYAPACDDLAGVAAALSALDVLLTKRKTWNGDVRVLLTRAEEVGFIGAIRACQGNLIPKTAKVIALETSRSFIESPLGAGPIVRVGDKTGIFDPGLTYMIRHIARELNEKRKDGFIWQRKLMPGGTCEATTYEAYGHEATCVCLPLGHYHNQGDIDRIEVGTNKKPAKAASEYIDLSDYHELVDLLVACGVGLSGHRHGPGGRERIRAMMEQIITKRGFVLEERR